VSLLHGTWAPALVAAPALAALLLVLAGRRSRRRTALLGPRVEDLTGGLRAPAWRRPVLVGAAVLLALVALLGPAWGAATATAAQRGADVIVCLDVSNSMLARDERPSRLGRAQREIRALAERGRGDRFGLIVFAGDARLAVPLTRDAPTFADLAEQADPTDVARGGTDLGAALDAALVALRGRSGRHETVVLVTDGEDAEGRGLRVAEICRDRGVVVHCVGLGSPQGAKVVVEDEQGRETFLRDRAGRDVVSAMDAAALRRIAETTGGTFVAAAGRAEALVPLYEQRILPTARRAFEDEERRERPQRFQTPLAAALLLWILDLWLARRD
jgi:Ca-activated chloride channel homolog